MATDVIEEAGDAAGQGPLGQGLIASSPAGRYLRIADGPNQGRCIGRLVNRQLHRDQKDKHWWRKGKHRFMTIDSGAYRANESEWDLLVVRDAEGTDLFVLPASRFRKLAFEMRTPSGMQLGVVLELWMRRTAVRNTNLFDFIPSEEWGTSRRTRDQPYALDAGEDAPARLLKGEPSETLTGEFAAYHAAHPNVFLEHVTCAYFALEMDWDADATSELLGLIEVDNNYRSRYRRMLVNLDAEFGPLVRIGGLKTQ